MSAGIAGRHTLITADGLRIIVQPMPHSQAIAVVAHDKAAGTLHQTLIPLDMVGAFTVSCTAAAQSVARRSDDCKLSLGIGPNSKFIQTLYPVARIPMRCHDSDACKAGQAACPSPAACGVMPCGAVELGVAL